MKKYLALILLLSYNSFSQEEKTIKYNYGIGLEYNMLLTKTINQDVNYFTSNYSNGSSTSILFNNKIIVNKWFMTFGGGISFITQKQTIVFSNALDPIITFDVMHKKKPFQINSGLGRVFNLPGKLKLNVELGIILNYFFSRATTVPDIKGSVAVKHINLDDFYIESTKNRIYDYAIKFNGYSVFSQWVKIGLLKEFNKRKIEFGVNYTNKKLEYQNLIVIKSTNYTAISDSRSESNGFGVYFNLFFNNK